MLSLSLIDIAKLLTPNLLYICKIDKTKLVHFSFSRAVDINEVVDEIADNTDTFDSLSRAELSQAPNKFSYITSASVLKVSIFILFSGFVDWEEL